MNAPAIANILKKISPQQLVFWMIIAAFFGMPMGTSPPTAASITAAAIWALSGMAFRSWRIFFIQDWCRPVLFLMILPWIGLLYSPDPAGLGMNYAGKTHYWLYCLALAGIAPAVNTERLVQAFLAGLALNAIIGLFQLIGIVPPKSGWYSGLGRGYSALSAYLVVGIMIAAFYFRRLHSTRHRIWALTMGALFFFHLIILQGRAGYMTLVAVGPFILRNLFQTVRIHILICFFVILIGAMLLSPVVRERLDISIDRLNYHLTADPDKAWGREYTSNQEERLYMWRGAIKIFLQHPLFGVGTGGYGETMQSKGKPDYPFIAHPHNDFLYMAASYGLVGIAAFIWLFFSIIKNSWKERHNVTGYFVFSTSLVILINGLVNAQILDAGATFLMAYAVGLQGKFKAFRHTSD